MKSEGRRGGGKESRGAERRRRPEGGEAKWFISNGELKGNVGSLRAGKPDPGFPPCSSAGPAPLSCAGQMDLGAKSPRPAAPQPVVPEPAAGAEVPLTTAVPDVRRSRPPELCLWVLKSGLSFSGVSVLKY